MSDKTDPPDIGSLKESFKRLMLKPNKTQTEQRMSQIKLAIKYVEKLNKRTVIPEKEIDRFNSILKVCLDSLNQGNGNILGNFCDLAEFLKSHECQLTKSSITITESIPTGNLNETIETSNTPTVEQDVDQNLNAKEIKETNVSDETINDHEDQEKLNNINLPEKDKNLRQKKVSIIKISEKTTQEEKKIDEIDLIEEVIDNIKKDETETKIKKQESSTNKINETSSSNLNLNNLSVKEQIALKNIQKLDQFCQELSKKIIEYESTELSLDDLEVEDSCFVNEAKLKKRFIKAYDKLILKCKQYPHLVDTESKITKIKGGQFNKKIKFEHTRYEDINNHITNSLNKLKQFPDYAEVYQWVNDSNDKFSLGLDDKKIDEISRSSFEEIGRMLKNRRIKNDRYILLSRIECLQNLNKENQEQENKKSEELFEYDPADQDKDLEAKLLNNKKIGDEKYEKIINEYVLKQENNEDYEDDENDDDEEEEEENESITISEENRNFLSPLEKSINKLLDNSLTPHNSSLRDINTDDDSINEDSTKIVNIEIDYAEQGEIENQVGPSTSKKSISNEKPKNITKKRDLENISPILLNKKQKLEENLNNTKSSDQNSSNKSMFSKPRIVSSSSASQISDDLIVLD